MDGKGPSNTSAKLPQQIDNILKGANYRCSKCRKQAHDAILAAQTLLGKGTNYHKYQKGDEVWLEVRNLKTTHPTHKLRDKHFGPFRICDVLGEVNYHLGNPTQLENP
jgi:hypothetical protein